MAKKTQPLTDKIIFVLLPHTVQYTTPVDPDAEGSMFSGNEKMSKCLPAGMLAAQTGHVVSLMRTDPTMLKKWGRQPITTITLSVRNTRELLKLRGELLTGVKVWTFDDTNYGFYGVRDGISTAVCTEPTDRAAVDDIIGHLELYKEIHKF